MHHYKGQLRRQPQGHTPTKSSWDHEKEPKYAQPPKNESLYQQQHYEIRPETRYDTRYDPKYDNKYDNRYDTRYEKSQLSYYQSEQSRVVSDYQRSERPSTRSHLAQDSYFNEIMRVRVKSYERQEYQTDLRVQIQTKIEKGQSMLGIMLTDDKNPKFLWSFMIKEVDFMTLKSEQKLKVSYSGFPQMLENFLRDCQHLQGAQTRAMHLVLQVRKGGQGTLYLLESNRYKESVLLFLHFKLANDQQIKQHLSGKLLSAQTQIEQQKTTISRLQQALSEKSRDLDRKSMQLNGMTIERDKIVEQMKLQQKKRINDMQSKNISSVSSLKKEHQQQVKQLNFKLGGQLQTLKKQKNQLLDRLNDSRQKITFLEANQRENILKIKRLEQDLEKYLKQADNLKSQNRDLSEKRFQNEKNITELTCRLESLRSELDDKKAIIQSSSQLKQTSNSQISTLQQQSIDQKKSISKLESKISQLQGQVSKLNGSNIEYQEKYLKQKEKTQQRTDIIKQQEKELKQTKRNESALQRSQEDLQFRLNELQKKYSTLQMQLNQSIHRLEEQKKFTQHLQNTLNKPSTIRSSYNNPIPAYTPPNAYPTLSRDGPSQLSANSNLGVSRTYAGTRSDKYQPTIKRYQQRERSKSPVPKRLAQQKDPQQEEIDGGSGFEQPRPVKFKKSQAGN